MTRQYPLPLPHHESMEADEFVVADSNHEAAAWVQRWPDWPHHCVIIYGPAGCGKTHLAKVWQKRSQAISVDAGDLQERVAGGLSQTCVIEACDIHAGDIVFEEALFHLYNRIAAAGSSMILTAAKPPALWGVKLPDLLSRLKASPAIEIKPPDDALMAMLLVKQFRDRQISVDTGVIDYLLARMDRSQEAVRKMVDDLDRAALAENRAITIALARRFVTSRDEEPARNPE